MKIAINPAWVQFKCKLWFYMYRPNECWKSHAVWDYVQVIASVSHWKNTVICLDDFLWDAMGLLIFVNSNEVWTDLIWIQRGGTLEPR